MSLGNAAMSNEGFAPPPAPEADEGHAERPLGVVAEEGRPVWKMIAQKAAVVLLVISVGFGAIMAASPTARAAFVRWAREWYETHITYRYGGRKSFPAPCPNIKSLRCPRDTLNIRGKKGQNK